MSITIEKAVITDSKAIQAIIKRFADSGDMLARSIQYVYDHIRDFYIAKHNGKTIGACAFTITSEDLAEIKSLAIEKEYHGQGLASKLLVAGFSDLKEIGIKKVFTLTYVPDFFVKNGFSLITKESLPHKIWTDCINCPSFPDCDEIALIRNI